MATYSFLNVSCALAGPTGIVNLAAGAASAEEGITIENVEDKNVMTVGADGKVQHSLIASDACTVTIRLLKTAPANALLQAFYDAQTQSSALWGINTITVTDAARGDISVMQSCAFKKKATLNYAKEGGMMEWVFDCGSVNSILGSGN